MSTDPTTAPPLSQVQSLKSSSIYTGADALIKIIEEEKARATADAQKAYKELEHKLVVSEAESKKRCDHLDATLKSAASLTIKVGKALEVANGETQKAREEVGATASQLETAKLELDQIKSSLEKHSLHYSPDGLYFRDCWIDLAAQLIRGDAIREDALTNVPVHPGILLEGLKQLLDENRRTVEQLQERLTSAEEARDKAKKTVETSIPALNSRLISLEAEVKELEASKNKPHTKMGVQAKVDDLGVETARKHDTSCATQKQDIPKLSSKAYSKTINTQSSNVPSSVSPFSQPEPTVISKAAVSSLPGNPSTSASSFSSNLSSSARNVVKLPSRGKLAISLADLRDAGKKSVTKSKISEKFESLRMPKRPIFNVSTTSSQPSKKKSKLSPTSSVTKLKHEASPTAAERFSFSSSSSDPIEMYIDMESDSDAVQMVKDSGVALG